MPIYPGRRKGTWRVTVWSHGRQSEQLIEGSRTDALEHEARLRLARGSRSRILKRTPPAFFVFCAEEYTPHAQAHLGADSWRKVRCYQVKSLASFFGTRRLTDLSASDVDLFVLQRSKEVSATTVNNELRVLGRMLRFAREDCGYDVPLLRLRKLRQIGRRVRVWTPVEAKRLLSVAERDDPELAPMVSFLFNTGCRKGEAIASLWSWVDRRRRALCVAAYDDGSWVPKNKRPREIPIGRPLSKVLAKLPRTSPWIFPNVSVERFAKFPDHRFRAIVDTARLKGSPHTCRHTYASLFLAAGGSLWELSAVLGHSTTRTTELYAHLLPGHLERARDLVAVAT